MLRLLVLDFDGVISDSAPEAFVVALRTYCEMRPGACLCDRDALLREAAAPERERVLSDPLYDGFLGLMPLGNRAEDYGVALCALDADEEIRDQEAYDRYKGRLDPDWLRAFHERFYRVRADMSDADPAGWHRLMGPYPRVPELLRRHASEVLLAIATSKDRRSVGRLLHAYGIDDLFPEGSVLDKETGVSKSAHLEHLHRSLGIAYREMAFVDDKVNHLDAVSALGVRCALASWGYNGSREEELARARGYPVLGLDDLDAGLLGGEGA